MTPTATTGTTTNRRSLEIKITRGPRGFVKKIGGKVVWLAPLDQPELARQRAIAKLADFHAGRTRQAVPTDRVSLADLGDVFLASKSMAVSTGELKLRTFADYKRAIQDACDFFGAGIAVGDISPNDWQRYRASIFTRFEDVHTRRRFIAGVRAMSKWAFASEQIDRPLRFGNAFLPPPKRAMREAVKIAGKRLFTPAEIKKIVAKADPVMKAMFLLALNAGFGNTDLASLPRSAVDLNKRVIEFDRPKTGIERRVPLWNETTQAVRAVLDLRPAPKIETDADLVFLTPKGHRYVRDHVDTEGGLSSTTDAIGMAFGKLAKGLNVHRSFYDARRTFRTFADESGDKPAVDLIMGHAGDRRDMGRHYVQDISIKRLKAVTDLVRQKALRGG